MIFLRNEPVVNQGLKREFWLKVMVKIVYAISMVADVVNLRQQRKRKARADKAQQGAENRAKHGRSLSARRQNEAETQRAEKAHEAHRLQERE